jgi:hypothetical protein
MRHARCGTVHDRGGADRRTQIVWSIILDTLGALAVLASVAAQIALLRKQ